MSKNINEFINYNKNDYKICYNIYNNTEIFINS